MRFCRLIINLQSINWGAGVNQKQLWNKESHIKKEQTFRLISSPEPWSFTGHPSSQFLNYLTSLILRRSVLFKDYWSFVQGGHVKHTWLVESKSSTSALQLMLHPTACPSQAAFPATCDNSLTWGSRSPLTQRDQITLFQQSTKASDLEVLTLILTAYHPSAYWKLLANEVKNYVIRKKAEIQFRGSQTWSLSSTWPHLKSLSMNTTTGLETGKATPRENVCLTHS